MKNTQKFNFSYDKENDDLFLFHPSSKSKGSVELGDFILDFSSKKELVGIQIMNASKLISEIVNEKISTIKKLLNNLKSCKVDFIFYSNTLGIKIYLSSQTKEVAFFCPILIIY